MTKIAYYSADISTFLTSDEDAVLGILTKRHGFSLEHQQKQAWQYQILMLKREIAPTTEGRIFFEFSIPRMGKRADVVIVTNGLIFVIEFKVGSHSFDAYAVNQVHDYALDLKNFHRGSHHLPIIPILISTAATSQAIPIIQWADDQIAEPICISPDNLIQVIDTNFENNRNAHIDIDAWELSGYQPTPTIVEAALALYRQHDVREITRSEAGADNLGVQTRLVIDTFNK